MDPSNTVVPVWLRCLKQAYEQTQQPYVQAPIFGYVFFWLGPCVPPTVSSWEKAELRLSHRLKTLYDKAASMTEYGSRKPLLEPIPQVCVGKVGICPLGTFYVL